MHTQPRFPLYFVYNMIKPNYPRCDKSYTTTRVLIYRVRPIKVYPKHFSVVLIRINTEIKLSLGIIAPACHVLDKFTYGNTYN